MLKRILRKLSVLFDTLKGILLTITAFSLIFTFTCTILHNVLKIGEISVKYTGSYKKLVPVVENKMMNIYVIGEGRKTIVILPEFGSESPIIQYKAISERLKQKYRIVIIEYFGYGFSMGINEERTNENITSEIKKALTEAKIYGRYILMSQSTSNIYAMYYSAAYPEDIEGMISINPTYPNEISEEYLASKIDDMANNVALNSIIELTGFFRVLSYVKPEAFYIDLMSADSVYTNEDIVIYRGRIASSHLTRTMVKEIKKLKTNMTQLQNFKYPSNVPVLQVLATEVVEEYEGYKLNKDVNKDIKDFANEVITNENIQRVVEIEGKQMLQLTNENEIVSYVDEFISSSL